MAVLFPKPVGCYLEVFLQPFEGHSIMRVRIERRAATEPEVRAHATQHVAVVLRRLSPLMPRLHVQPSDMNGPRGGPDKR